MTGCTLFACCAGLTVTVVEPDLEVSCVEVAVMVTGVLVATVCAVTEPEDEIVPALAGLALHVTVELKLPVPITVAMHWLVWPEVTVDGEQATVTDVMVDPPFPPPLEPQEAIHNTLPTTSNSPILRILIVSLADVAGLDSSWH
jgi:hypothetical protein